MFLYSNIYFKCGNNYTANLLGCTTGIDNTGAISGVCGFIVGQF